MGGDFQDALLKIVIESIPCIFLVQSAIGLKVFSHSFNSVSWFLSTLFCIYILSPIIMLILTRKPCSKKKLIKKMIFVLITYVIVTVMFIKIDNNTFFDDLCYGSPYRRIFYVVFGMLIEYSRAMKSHFRKFGNQMSGSGNHLCNYASLLA